MKTSLVFAVLLIVWMAWKYGGEWLLKGGG